MPDKATEIEKPSTPNPTTTVLVGTAIRALLMVLGPGIAARGITVSDGQVEMIAGGIVTAGGIAWSFWQKYQQAKLDHLGNVASARGGTAVKVTAANEVPAP